MTYAFNLQSTNQQHSALSIYTNSIVVYQDIRKTIIYSIVNKLLYKIILAAIAYNIIISAKQILGNLNNLANTLF